MTKQRGSCGSCRVKGWRGMSNREVKGCPKIRYRSSSTVRQRRSRRSFSGVNGFWSRTCSNSKGSNMASWNGLEPYSDVSTCSASASLLAARRTSMLFSVRSAAKKHKSATQPAAMRLRCMQSLCGDITVKTLKSRNGQGRNSSLSSNFSKGRTGAMISLMAGRAACYLSILRSWKFPYHVSFQIMNVSRSWKFSAQSILSGVNVLTKIFTSEMKSSNLVRNSQILKFFSIVIN